MRLEWTRYCLLGGLLFGTSFSASAHRGDDESRVSLVLESQAPVTETFPNCSFRLVDHDLNRSLTDEDLTLSHERKLHFLVYDSSLQEFQHVHPEYRTDHWEVRLGFTVSGRYRFWAQGELLDGTGFSTSVTQEVEIPNSQPWPLPPVLREVRQGEDGNSVVTLSSEKLHVGQPAMMSVILSRKDGTAAEITPYLGAFAHILVTPLEGDLLLHVHPMSGAKPNEGILHTLFPYPGIYRVWIQFLDASELKTVALAVEVLK